MQVDKTEVTVCFEPKTEILYNMRLTEREFHALARLVVSAQRNSFMAISAPDKSDRPYLNQIVEAIEEAV
jgi:hypothetical protein